MAIFSALSIDQICIFATLKTVCRKLNVVKLTNLEIKRNILIKYCGLKAFINYKNEIRYEFIKLY